MKKAILLIGLTTCLALLVGWSVQSFETESVPMQEVSVVNYLPAGADVSPDFTPMNGARCYQCSASGSTGKCSGKNRCRGTKKSCKKRGCKFTGGSSSSCTAANYKYCGR